MTQQEHAAIQFFAADAEDKMCAWEKRMLAYYRGEGRMPRPKGRRVLKPLRDDYQRVTDELRIAIAAVPRKGKERMNTKPQDCGQETRRG